MGNIEKSKSKISKKDRPHPEWNVGDTLLDVHRSDNPNLLKITKLTKKKIVYDHWVHFTDGTQGWSYYGSSTWEEFDHYHQYIKLEKDWEEYEKEALQEIQDIDKLKENLGLTTVSTETQLATVGDKDILTAAKSKMVRRKNKVEIIRAVLQDKITALSTVVNNFKNQIQKIERVIGVVELYLGVHEEIYQIQSGEPSSLNEPISIRQQLLYMDEEIGDPTDGGLDFQRLEDWDNWVITPENLQQVLPEKKGVVAIRVRRTDKCYASGGTIGDAFINTIMNQDNYKTYFLIRNGDNVYRIWSNIVVDPRLFPTKEELNNPPDDDDYFRKRDWEESEFEYKKYGLFLQGLLHRTQIFQPLSEEIHIFQPETWNNMLNFIRDDEMLLPSGKLSWREWQKEINSKIQEGSRIIYHGSDFTFLSLEKLGNRVPYQHRNGRAPSGGMYTARKSLHPNSKYEDGDGFRFLYNPEDEIWTYDRWDGHSTHIRKNRISFTFYMDEVLNYDQVSLEDLEFYINCRTERRHYLKMMPLLYKLRRMRLEELERERLFVQLVVTRNNVPEEKIWELVKWWKYKNKWKRPIDMDDAKALRMIERRLKKTV